MKRKAVDCSALSGHADGLLRSKEMSPANARQVSGSRMSLQQCLLQGSLYPILPEAEHSYPIGMTVLFIPD